LLILLPVLQTRIRYMGVKISKLFESAWKTL
jgi:hypothetical protein